MNALIIVIIGVLLMILEVLFLDFTLLFFGISFVVVGLASFAVEISWQMQILFAFILALILLFTLKKPIKRYFHKGENFNQEFLDESGTGEIKDGMIYFKGTLWQSNEISDLKEGDKVAIKGIKNNKILVDLDK